MIQYCLVIDSYFNASATKMEKALMEYAKKKYMYALLDKDELPLVVEDLNAKQDELLAANKRLKKVNVGFWDSDYSNGITLHIGGMNLSLRKADKVISLRGKSAAAVRPSVSALPRIVYKPGHNGVNKLDVIEGIAVPLITGEELLVLPKYETCALCEDENIPSKDEWPCRDEWAAVLDLRSGKEETDLLVEHKSPAALYVRSWGEKCNLPTLFQLFHIMNYRAEINELAANIEGADQLGSYVWSSSRYYAYNAWISYGNGGCAGYYYVCYAVLAVPCVLLDVDEVGA
ncbi:MAG: hypothetical protein K6C37_06720 [Bacteroidales bacterium]|nr:hypothetical protein [Bacteroidales bacterium]